MKMTVEIENEISREENSYLPQSTHMAYVKINNENEMADDIMKYRNLKLGVSEMKAARLGLKNGVKKAENMA
jgi:hypothetical protein